MPPFDEDGNIIGIDEFQIALRGDDSVEWIIPGSPPPGVFEMSIPEFEDHDFLLTKKSSESMIRIIKEAMKERDRLLKKADRLIRRCYRLQELTRREKLKGASMDRLWDIQLRRITIAGELGNIYRRLQPWE